MGLQAEMDYYEARKTEFEREHRLEWVIIRNCEVLGFFNDFQRAAARYEHEYDGTPMLLKRIGFVPQPQRFMFAEVDKPS